MGKMIKKNEMIKFPLAVADICKTARSCEVPAIFRKVEALKNE